MFIDLVSISSVKDLMVPVIRGIIADKGGVVFFGCASISETIVSLQG